VYICVCSSSNSKFSKLNFISLVNNNQKYQQKKTYYINKFVANKMVKKIKLQINK
jgi:hypothetical protein